MTYIAALNLAAAAIAPSMASTDDPVASGAWLDDAFDYSKLTMIELRRIFTEHNVDFKATAKKSELVRTYEQEILPKLAQIRRQMTATPERSSNVIEHVGQGGGGATDVETPVKRGPGRPRKSVANTPAVPKTPATVKRGVGRPRKVPVEEDEPQTTTTKRRRTKKSGDVTETEPETAEEDDVKVEVLSPSKRPRKSAAKSAKSAEDTGEESEAPTTVRSTKRKATTATAVDSPKKPKTSPRKSRAAKVEPEPSSSVEPETEPEAAPTTVVKDNNKHSRFSTDNPFQSGSTPTGPSSTQKRRHTAVPNSDQKLPPPDRSPRRKSEFVTSPRPQSIENELQTPLRNKFMPQVSTLKSSPAFQSAAQRRIENDAMADQLTKIPEVDVVEVQATAPDSSPLSLVKILQSAALFGVFALASFGATQWRAEKIKAGFCDVDSLPRRLPIDAPLADRIADSIVPDCTPCPPHATCLPGFEVKCDDGFVQVANPMSLGGLLPLPPACLPDTEKLRKIQIVATEVVQQLRDQNAAFECGHADTASLTEGELHDKLKARKSATLTDDRFEDLFQHAIDDIGGRDEIVQ